MKDISVTLGVHSKTLTPEDITRIARCEPDDTARRGDIRSKRRPPRTHSYWCISVADQSGREFSDLVLELVARVPESFREDVIRSDPDAQIHVWVGMFDVQDQGAFEIPADLSRELAARGLDLVFDLYIQSPAISPEDSPPGQEPG
jgi:hypothetical protein